MDGFAELGGQFDGPLWRAGRAAALSTIPPGFSSHLPGLSTGSPGSLPTGPGAVAGNGLPSLPQLPQGLSPQLLLAQIQNSQAAALPPFQPNFGVGGTLPGINAPGMSPQLGLAPMIGMPNLISSAQVAQEDARKNSQRGRLTIEQAETREKLAEAQSMKCHLHKKAKLGCKFCKKYSELMNVAQIINDKAIEKSERESRKKKQKNKFREERENPDSRGPLLLANPKTYGFSGLLQTHVVECAHFKSLLSLESFEQVVDETYQFANSAEPYMANSGTLPSALFCCLYRFFTLGLDSRQLRRLVESQESAYIRCCGFLWIRFGLPHDQIVYWLSEYVLDDEEFRPSPESEYRTSIGEYVELLLSQDKYYSTVLPRLPMVTKRQVEEMLAPIHQNRKRMQANKTILDSFREAGVRVECCMNGEWLGGTLIELEEEPPNRPKVRVRMDDGSEEYVHLGLVIVSAAARSRRPPTRPHETGRKSRSRSRTDWSREKGRSDRELIDEMRSRERERAVCSTGKDYARKPVGYKAACALPREQGAASYRLMEEETFVPMNRQKARRSPTPERESFGRRPSAEHQARMQQLFEKYGSAKGSGSEDRHHDDGVDKVDVMRLG